MQWADEGKKLDCAVKHMSWVPPWVEQESKGMEPVGHRFLGDESILVPDEVGLGRYPSLWWTMNCHYNAAYDVQRMNVESRLGNAAVDGLMEGDKRERFEFARDSPDLVAQMMAVRTELMMRVVMPAVVPHSDSAPYMCMARFETGPGGNPHHHGFSIGTAGPKVGRVQADLEASNLRSLAAQL